MGQASRGLKFGEGRCVTKNFPLLWGFVRRKPLTKARLPNEGKVRSGTRGGASLYTPSTISSSVAHTNTH